MDVKCATCFFLCCTLGKSETQNKNNFKVYWLFLRYKRQKYTRKHYMWNKGYLCKFLLKMFLRCSAGGGIIVKFFKKKKNVIHCLVGSCCHLATKVEHYRECLKNHFQWHALNTNFIELFLLSRALHQWNVF